MADQIVVEQPVSDQQAPVQSPVLEQGTMTEPDLLTKVTQFKSQTAASEIKNAPEQPEFEAIKDPVAREAAKQAVERMRRGFQSEHTKKMEEAQRIVEQSKNWTPQRIQQELLNNPEFLSAAQQIASMQNPSNSGLTDAEFSALTPSEKAEIASLKSELSQMRENNNQSAIRADISQSDAKLQARFSDYNPVEIDNATKELAGLTLAGVREHVYKAKMHDAHVKAAYEMGKQDGRGITQTKINGISQDGISSNANDSIPTKDNGETNQAFFLRLAKRNLDLSRRK